MCAMELYFLLCYNCTIIYKNTSCMYALHSMINYVIMIHVTNGSGVHRVTITLQDRLYPRQVSLLDSTVYVCSMCAACALFEMRSENFVCAFNGVCMFHVCCMCSV